MSFLLKASETEAAAGFARGMALAKIQVANNEEKATTWRIVPEANFQFSSRQKRL